MGCDCEDACTGPEGAKGYSRHELLTRAPAVTSASIKLSPLPTGVLEDSSVRDRPAVEKAKTLYRSCMNESESSCLLAQSAPSLHQHTETPWGVVRVVQDTYKVSLCCASCGLAHYQLPCVLGFVTLACGYIVQRYHPCLLSFRIGT